MNLLNLNNSKCSTRIKLGKTIYINEWDTAWKKRIARERMNKTGNYLLLFHTVRLKSVSCQEYHK